MNFLKGGTFIPFWFCGSMTALYFYIEGKNEKQISN